MDFIYDLESRNKEWRGSLIDPDKGKVYNCTIKHDGNALNMRLSLRGVLGFLGMNQTLLPADLSGLPDGVFVPDAGTIFPIIR
jgi:uncharacterized protein (DUF2147 family)